jgi:hypothetical protein
MDGSGVQASVRLPTGRYGRAGRLEFPERMRSLEPRARRRSPRTGRRARIGGRICAVLVLALAIAITLAIVAKLR